MLAAIPFPNLSPEIFSISIGGFEFALRWYALAYIVGILIGWRIVIHACARPAIWGRETPLMTREQIDDLLTWVILGVIIGGRLGFVLFYQPAYYLQNPLEIPMIWQGGMAFHGGFLGVVAVIAWFCWKHKIPLWNLADALAMATPPAIFLGRIANFINAELYGRPTPEGSTWGMIFPEGYVRGSTPSAYNWQTGDWVYRGDEVARYPSQIYEAVLEGLIPAIILSILVWRFKALQRPGLVAGLFLLFYAFGRTVSEQFREPDAFVSGLPEWITMGQILSLPMWIGGAWLVWAALKTKSAVSSAAS